MILQSLPMKVSDIVIKFLESKGISHVFTISGGGCIHLIDSLGNSDKLKYVCVHHEQAAAIAVEGYARLKQDIGACIVTTGPGGTNTLTGVMGCWLDSVPSIFISGQVSLSQISEGTGCRQIGDQEFDIVSTVKTMTKYATMIRDKSTILYELEKSYDIATTGRPGPVWIDIPLDIQGAIVDESSLHKYTPTTKTNLVSKSDINTFVDLIKNSKRPLFIAGNGIRLSNSYELFNNLLRETNIPALTGVHSGIDCIDNTYEYYAGRVGILGQITSNKIIQETDLLIVIGSRLNVKMTGYNLPGFAPNAKKIFIDIDEYEMNKHKLSNIVLKIRADINIFLKQLPSLELPNISEWQSRVKQLRSEQKYYYDKHINMKEYASAYYFTDRLKHFAGNSPIITSNGSAHVVTLQTYQLKKHQRLFTNVGCASMGYGLPAAIGAAFVNKNEDIICIEGDGSLQMNIQELQTLVHYNLPVKMFVINNDGYLSIKITQESFFGGKQIASGKESGISFPNLQKICKAYGLPYVKITKNNQYDKKLKQVFNIKGPVVCELITHPYEKHEPKVVHKGIDSDGRIIPGELTDMFISDIFNL
jgi:acetolactate synthase-1/2/3 large subunit